MFLVLLMVTGYVLLVMCCWLCVVGYVLFVLCFFLCCWFSFVGCFVSGYVGGVDNAVNSDGGDIAHSNS